MNTINPNGGSMLPFMENPVERAHQSFAPGALVPADLQRQSQPLVLTSVMAQAHPPPVQISMTDFIRR